MAQIKFQDVLRNAITFLLINTQKKIGLLGTKANKR